MEELLGGASEPSRLRKLLMSFSIGRFSVVLSMAAVLIVVYIGANSPGGGVAEMPAPPVGTSPAPDPSPAPGPTAPDVTPAPSAPDPARVVQPPVIPPTPSAPDPAPEVTLPVIVPPDPADEFQALGSDPTPQALAEFITRYPAYEDAQRAYAAGVGQAFASGQYEQSAGMTADLLDEPVRMELPIEFRKILWSVRTWTFYERRAWNETLEYGRELQELTSDGSCSGCVEAIMSIRSKEYSGNALEFALARAEVRAGSAPYFERLQKFLKDNIDGDDWYSNHPDFLVALAEAVDRDSGDQEVAVASRSLGFWINNSPLGDSLEQAMNFFEGEIRVATSFPEGGQ